MRFGGNLKFLKVNVFPASEFPAHGDGDSVRKWVRNEKSEPYATPEKVTEEELNFRRQSYYTDMAAL